MTIEYDGILPRQDILRLIEDHKVANATFRPIDTNNIQPASLDLRLGNIAYQLRASFLPGDDFPLDTVDKYLRANNGITMNEFSIQDGAVLEVGFVYLIPLQEYLDLPDNIHAKSNPKSTTGRLDIFARLITDFQPEFDNIRAGYLGNLYLEVIPRTFPIVVRTGDSLNQIRFIKGDPELTDKELKEQDYLDPLTYSGDKHLTADIKNGVNLSVNLLSKNNDDVIAYQSPRNSYAPPIDLVRRDYKVQDYWNEYRNLAEPWIILNPGHIYILRTLEKVSVPAKFAAELVPFDPAYGEFRTHYAGFFDPGFGVHPDAPSERQGTSAVLEVRAHDAPFILRHGQTVGRLVYSRMTEQPDVIYGNKIGSSYNEQGLALSKQFKR